MRREKTIGTWTLRILATTLAGAVVPAAAQARPPGSRETRTVSYTRDIAPIVFSKCAACHRPQGAGPFSLLNYRETKKRARQIAIVTRDRFMPPWQPEPGDVEFIGERRLEADEIDLFREWLVGGAIEGDPADLPPLPEFSEAWPLGEPDLVVTLEEPYELSASGADVIRNFVIPLPVDSTCYVKTVDLRPGNSAIVHHAIVKTDPTRVSMRRAAADPEPGFGGMDMGHAEAPDGHIIVWAPGTTPYAGRDDIAWKLDAGTDLVLQLHMVPSGKPEPIRPEVALYFAKRPPSRSALGLVLRSEQIDIPPGTLDYEVSDSLELPRPVEVLGLFPHAHYLGKQMQVWATLPDGSRRVLLEIQDWDFNWQDMYRYTTPVRLPAGTTIQMRYTYDNSSENIQNPNQPPRRVVGGNASTDEMATLGLQVLPLDPADLDVLNAAQFEKLVRDDPRNGIAHYNLGLIYAGRGELQRAAGHYETALAVDPSDAGSHFNLGGVLARQGEFEAAAGHFEAATRHRPGFAEAHYFLGRARMDQGDGDRAEAQFLRALEIDPAFANAHYNLGLIYMARGERDLAAAHLARTLELQPDHEEARRRLDRLGESDEGR